MKNFLLYLLFVLFSFSGIAQGLETFEKIPASSPKEKYETRSWVGDGGISWEAIDSRSDHTINEKAILVRNGSLKSGTIANGIGELSFKHQQQFTGTNSILEVYINGTLIGEVKPTAELDTATFSSINVVGDIVIEIKQITKGLRIKIDDLTWTGYTGVACQSPLASPSFFSASSITVSGATISWQAALPAPNKYLVTYATAPQTSDADKPVDGTTYSIDAALGSGKVAYMGSSDSFNISGLNSGTTYYFNIWSENDLCTGGPLYKQTEPLMGNFTTITLSDCVAPAEVGSNLVLVAGATSIRGDFKAPVVAVADSFLVAYAPYVEGAMPAISSPANGSNYSIGDKLGDLTIAAKTASPSFFISGLEVEKIYWIYIYGYNAANCLNGPAYTIASLKDTTKTGSIVLELPAGYYDTTIGKTCAELKSALSWRTGNTVNKMPVTPKTYTDLWAEYQISDIKDREVGTGSAKVIWDIYSDDPAGPDPYNFTPGTHQDGGGAASSEGILYNREHTVPLSWFSGSTSTPGPATDYLHILPTDKFVNATRANYSYGEVATATYTTLNGGKLGESTWAGVPGTVFEPIDAYKGDVARGFMYFVTRYQDNMPGWTGAGTGGENAFAPNTFPSIDTPYLRLMISWHNLDAVSEKEVNRNKASFAFQENRNPFVDHPEFVDMIWGNNCILPVLLTYFKGNFSNNKVVLNWQAANEVNFNHYEIERSVNGVNFTKIQTAYANNSQNHTFTDLLENQLGRRLYYRLKIVDNDGGHTYSELYTVHIPGTQDISLFPNPASKYLQINFANISFDGIVSIIDFNGKTVMTKRVKSTGGSQNISLPKIPSGSYLVQLKATNSNVVFKAKTITIIN